MSDAQLSDKYYVIYDAIPGVRIVSRELPSRDSAEHYRSQVDPIRDPVIVCPAKSPVEMDTITH